MSGRVFCLASLRLTGILLLLACGGCRQGMYNQPKTKPLSSSPLFSDGAAARSLVDGTIPRQWRGDEPACTGKTADGKLLATLPVPLTRELLERGRERYDIYCSVCHDRTGAGLGMIVQRGFPQPPSFHLDRLRQVPIGYFFDVISHGYGAMYPYSSRVEPADRWAIAAYIRVLQLSENARPEDVPPSDQTKLEPRS